MGVNRLSYPAFALDVFVEAVSIVRAGEVIQQRALFGNLVWNGQGMLQGFLLGNPDGHTVGVADQNLDEYEAALIDADSELKAVSAGEPGEAKAIDPATLAMILQLIGMGLDLIRQWRQRRKNPQPANAPIDAE